MNLLLTIIETLVKWLWNFLNFSRKLILNLIFIIIVTVTATAWFVRDSPELPKSAALRLNPSGRIVETAPSDNLWQHLLENDFEEIQNIPLQNILDSISAAASDPKITLILLETDKIEQISLGQIESIGKALKDFKKSGKMVIAFGNNFSQSRYLLASYADEIILNPIGQIKLKGFSRYRLYGRQALAKLKVNFKLFRAGKYKSALEPFFRDNMSEAAKTANLEWLNDLWSNTCQHILKNRPQLTWEKLNDYVNNYTLRLTENQGDGATTALNANLVDHIMSQPQTRKYISELVGKDKNDTFDFARIYWRDYSRLIKKSYKKPPTSARIALITACGEILPGRQPETRIGAESLGNLLRKARRDPEIKAVVLRIDSGGGSMTASEIIRQEILQLKKSGKPVVISMGRLAASGAYWISADADEIWAEATTLTGSIGVFGALPTFEESLAEIGISSDGVSTNPDANKISLTRSLQPQAARALQLSVNHGYRRFLEIVAGGRHLSINEVEKLAGGRVFSGSRAKDLGLVDHLGSLRDAVNSAAARVGLNADDAVYLQNEKSVTDFISDFISGRKAVFGNWLSLLLPKPYTELSTRLNNAGTFINLNDPQNLYVNSLLGTLANGQ